MKTFFTAASALFVTAAVASAAPSLMFDFGPNAITAGSQTVSPAHAVGTIPLADTTWNTVTTTAQQTSLKYADNTDATGVTLTTGQEATGGNGIVNFSTAIGSVGLVGNGGGTAGAQKLVGTGSIYGQDSPTAITTAARDGFIGGGTATGTGAAIGIRIDGLAVGEYVVYVTARNTNSNNPSGIAPMNIYTSVGASAGTFTFSSLTPVQQANTNYTTANYAGEYNTFTAGESYVAVSFSISAGQSLFLAVDGANNAVERRGFVNSIQIVAVPEPSTYAAGIFGLLALAAVVRRRQRA